MRQDFANEAMVLAAMLVFVIEKDFLKAAGWMVIAAVLSALGVIHAYELTPTGVQNRFGLLAAPEFALMYALSAGFLSLMHVVGRKR
jgi:adenine/guanine/hypoxanthine permease